MSPILRPPAPLMAKPPQPLRGRIRAPGDRSIAHRALMLGALSIGETTIEGLTESDDILATLAAMRAFGALATRTEPGTWRLRGVGVGGFLEPEDVIDFGSAGTGIRLAMGLVGSQAITATFTGDAGLRARSFGRFLDPLRRMGVQVLARSNDRLPLTVKGPDITLPLEYRMPVASAQVKSAVLLAGLNTPGVTTLIEPVATRDHTERLLARFGAAIEIDTNEDGERLVRLEGRRDLKAQSVTLPGDPSIAAYAIVAALLVEGSDLTIESVLLNPMRSGLIETLIEMGGDISVTDRRALGGEEVGDIRIRSSRLRGVAVPAARAPSMIDEYPLLAVAAAFADGTTTMEGLGELRLKASDRIATVAAGLAALGITVEEGPESLAVTGGASPAGAGRVAIRRDPRLAMSFLVLGMASPGGVTIDDGGMIQPHFPEFLSLMNGLGVQFEKAELPAA
jgi:3-phosphoshikimate 1-carboxyvinyltransferase